MLTAAEGNNFLSLSQFLAKSVNPKKKILALSGIDYLIKKLQNDLKNKLNNSTSVTFYFKVWLHECSQLQEGKGFCHVSISCRKSLRKILALSAIDSFKSHKNNSKINETTP